MVRQKYQMKNYNWILFVDVLLLSLAGVLFINSADNSYTVRQLIGLIFGVLFMIAFAFLDFKKICNFSKILYILNIIMLLIVEFAGVKVGGARRWISLGVTNIQPSEFTKIIMIIFVATYIQEHEEDFNKPKTLIKLAALCVIPVFLVMVEPDLSTTIDIVFILLAVIYVGGLNYKIIRNCLLVLIPLSFIFIWYIQTPNQIILQDYQVKRIMTFINPAKYKDTTMYQQDNSVMAIGSGQLYGKGLNNNTISDVSVTDTGFVSEQQTDFIFSVVGEEFGFIGSVFVIALLAIIVLQCLLMAHRARNLSGKLIATGMAALVGFQSFINVGVATAILPNTGLPLPFLSYGLTSLLACMVGMGIVLNIGLQRQY